MDTSETYIKMCDCEEIQEQWKTIPYQVPERNPLDTFKYNQTDQLGNFIYTTPQGNIWLPRQDQLQEMVNDLPESPKHIINRLYDFADFVHKKPYLPRRFKDIEKDEACHFFASMEQLWLAFVIKEKYNKVWDGEKWKQ